MQGGLLQSFGIWDILCSCLGHTVGNTDFMSLWVWNLVSRPDRHEAVNQECHDCLLDYSGTLIPTYQTTRPHNPEDMDNLSLFQNRVLRIVLNKGRGK
jgi:hypothetical protein